MKSSTNESPCQGRSLSAENLAAARPPALNTPGAEGAPPSGNTGAQTALIDWCGLTFPDGTRLEEVCQRFNVGDFLPLPSGRQGYRQAIICGNVQVLFDGQEGMGIHVEASGQGCRELEAAGVVTDWTCFLGQQIVAGAKFSRLDIALDDRAGLLNLQEIRWSIEDGLVVTRYRDAVLTRKMNVRAGEDNGCSVRFGSGKAESLIRFYDKAAEQHLPGHWIRCELQVRGKSANKLAQILAKAGNLEPVARILLGKLDFKLRGTHSQRERWASAGWWGSFLAAVAPLRLSLSPVVRTLEHVEEWLHHAIGPTLAAWLEARGGDLDRLLGLVNHGAARYRRWHKELIKAATGPPAAAASSGAA